MDKLAELIRDTDIGGVLAALADEGIIKVADAEELGELTEAVGECIGDSSYSIEKVAEIADILLEI